MELRVNDYVRTKYGITQIKENVCLLDEVIKSSPNIIDLIEVGDYVNGILINDITIYPKGKVVGNRNSEDLWEESFKNDEIKSILTKEQFESMEYRIGE